MTDLVNLALSALRAHKLRSFLSTLGIAIGVGSVVLLTSIGEGTRQFMLEQFTQFGTNLIAIHPGKTTTVGIPGILGGTTNPLTLEDALAVARLPMVEAAVPLAMGSARVEAGNRGRSVFVYGVTPDLPEVLKFEVRQGSFWPETDPRQAGQAAVLGPTLKQELFGEENALGGLVRIAGTRFRVVGILEPKGQMVGFDIDDAAYIPVATAMRIFNLEELSEIDLTVNSGFPIETVVAAIVALLTERHGGEEDFTVTNQEAMLETFDNVMGIITAGIGAIAAISILVGAVGILTMMWIAVGERTGEIGLMRAIGATRAQVRLIFLTEAGALSTLGGIVGLAGALGVCQLLRDLVPGLPVRTPLLFVLLAIVVSLGTGILSGVLPAQRAARLDPIESLRAE
ncbi:MAG TPA: ABC transporter permease [Thermoanaerobaculia bacterium]|nr:ABC transporter permease [Thermoanaerobaculia bacterium]